MRRAVDQERGQALVEFALVLPVAALLIVGLFDSARAVWLTATLAHATREGSRYAIVHGAQSSSPSTDTVIDGVVRQYAIGVAGMTVSATWPDGDAKRGSRVTVAATAPFTPVLSQALLGGGLSVTLRGSSTLVIHQ